MTEPSRSKSMIYKNYRAEISYSEDDEVFVGRVVNIERDMIAFDGYSVEELKQAFKSVIDEYLQDCMKAGKPPEKPVLQAVAA
jgi:predicted HicB family RNase H-like nuclease